MECDTGSGVSICSFTDYKSYFAHLPFKKSNVRLTVLTGDKLKMLGITNVKVPYKDKKIILDLVVVQSIKPFVPLLGRNWMNIMFPDWRNLFYVNMVNSRDDFHARILNEIKHNYKELFDQDLTNPIIGAEANIQLEDNTQPIFFKAYTLPLGLKEKVATELNKLVKEDILERVTRSQWASPIVIVPKQNNEIRICADYSVTINKYIRSEHYPLPVIDEVLASLSGARYFCTLDLRGAYMQLKVSKQTQELLTINTHIGLFTYKRLPYGIKPAASIFQKVMDEILEGIPFTFCYIDDILIGASEWNELSERLTTVLDRLKKYNVKINYGKCNFFVEKISYLGHEVSALGIEPNKKKIEAIVKAPKPTDISQLKSFIGLMNYYSKFIPSLNVKLRAFYDLLKKGSKWDWTAECDIVFEQCKKDILRNNILEHFDPKKPIVVVCDASDRGISGILCHIVNGVEMPVFFVSRTLSKSEKNYPILHREALAIVFAMEKFYKYVFGHKVTIYTDHKPLGGIFNTKKGEPAVAATRLQRYIMRLSIFDYELKFREGKKNGNADCLSRLPNVDEETEENTVDENWEIKNIVTGNSGELTLNIDRIRDETHKDAVLVKLYGFVKNGWNTSHIQPNYKSYYAKNSLLSIESGCLVLGTRIIIPRSLQEGVLRLLHSNHSGIVRMKQMARKHVFWEGINKDITEYVKSCRSCQAVQREKPDKVYVAWPQPKAPFERVHIDFFYFEGKQFLILIDVFSRWLEIFMMPFTTAEKVCQTLNSVSAVFGNPLELVCDNGPPFNSQFFLDFCKKRGIKLTHSPPFHPPSNGSVERAVQSTKAVLKKFILDSNRHKFDLKSSIERFLSNYRNLPCTEKGFIPSEKLLRFKPRNCLDLLQTKLGINSSTGDELNQNLNQKDYHSKKSYKRKNNLEKQSPYEVIDQPPTRKIPKIPKFVKGEDILYLNKNKGYVKWITGKILRKKGCTVYEIIINNRVKLAHVNQLRKCKLKENLYITDRNKHQSIDSGTKCNPSPSKSPPTCEKRNEMSSGNEEELPRRTGRFRKTTSFYKPIDWRI